MNSENEITVSHVTILAQAVFAGIELHRNGHRGTEVAGRSDPSLAALVRASPR